ncbi:MAG: heavy metal translocating P-type ATPase [Lachnospiraceae bacterium]|nr:heavy metal translocating P-type ATPase [Lachnospiraceae bacterium]
MSCAACSARVEKAVSGVKGVTSCSVSLLTNSMGVEGNASAEEIIKAVEDAGYGASLRGGKRQVAEDYSRQLKEQQEALEDKESPKLAKRLAASVIVLLILMYFSMGFMMWGWPAPKAFENHLFLGLFEMLLTIIVMIINGRFFINGFRSLMHLAPNMDALVALGAGTAFLYSTVEMFVMINAMGNGDHETVMKYGMNLYFESAAMILTLITIGKLLEAKSKGRTTDALKSLMKLSPKTALLVENGREREVPIEEITVGDVFAVKPGGSIPVDGEVIEGITSVNEAALTGESIPVDKKEGDRVSAATVNQSGYIRCRALRVGEDTTLSQIIKMVSDAAATKAPLARIADKVSGVFVPAVMGIALLTMIGWLIAGQDFTFAIERAITVLVISCPCALGLATPVAIMVGNGVGAKNGILYKTAAGLENLGRTAIVALDKTGTITKGEPEATDILADIDEKEFLRLAATLEKHSEHPLAKAVCREAAKAGIEPQEAGHLEVFPGNGLSAEFEGSMLYGGNPGYIINVMDARRDNKAGAFKDRETLITSCDRLANSGKTPLVFAKDNELLGIIAVADTIKDDSPEAIRQLRGMGLKVVMLTGDNSITAGAIGQKAGVDEVIAGVLPDGKEEVIRSLQKDGRTAMIGDGINDAPALVRADSGIAIGAGTDVAIDAGDIVLVKSRLTDAAAAVRLSRATIRNIHQNLFWAFFYNVICIPLAMGLYGLEMKPMYGAAAMSLSSFFVCMNALRINLIDIYDPKHDKKLRQKRRSDSGTANEGNNGNAGTKVNIEKTGSESKSGGLGGSGRTENNGAITDKDFKDNNTEGKNNMTKTLKVEGMMCEHCEARVKKALEAIDGVESATASHKEGTAVVTLSKDVDDDVLASAVEAQDYKVIR